MRVLVVRDVEAGRCGDSLFLELGMLLRGLPAGCSVSLLLTTALEQRDFAPARGREHIFEHKKWPPLAAHRAFGTR